MLEKSGILLRPITMDDTQNILKWRNSIEVKKYFCMQQDLTKEQHEWWLKNRVETGCVIQYIIVDQQTNQDLGTVYIRDIDEEHLNGEFGIYIGEAVSRNKGIGTIAMDMICDYAFKELKLHKIFLRVLADNLAAIKVYKKNGFIEEGLFKEHIRNQLGEYKDLVFMGRMNPYE